MGSQKNFNEKTSTETLMKTSTKRLTNNVIIMFLHIFSGEWHVKLLHQVQPHEHRRWQDEWHQRD